MEEYLSLPEKFIIPEYKLKHDSPNYDKEARAVLQQIKSFFPQFSFFADNFQESFYEILDSDSEKEAIRTNYIVYKSTNFQVIPNDEKDTLKFIEQMKKFVQTPEILDILLRINYIYDSFPSLTPILDNLLLSISIQNENPLIKLVLISQLFSMPSRRVQKKIYEFETIETQYPGKIVSCFFDQKNQQILPLTVTNPLFPVAQNSIYLRYHDYDFVFSPSEKNVYFCQTSAKKKISTKQFSEFLINDKEKIEEIGIFNDQLCFVQELFESSNSKLRITIFKKGILVHDIVKKDYIVELDEEYEKCKLFQNNLMIFMKSGKKFIYNIGKRILNKEPIPSQFYFDFNDSTVYDKVKEVFILPVFDEKKLIYQIIKREKKKSDFVQIIPPFYGVQTDEIISHVSFEIMNSCTEVISGLMHSKSSIETNLVSDPLLHIQYALDLSETIQKNELNHDQNLCDYCLIALTRFIIINIYQLNVNNQKLADFQIQRITRLFSSIKMSIPHFDTLFALISIINHGIYTTNFISNVHHQFVPLIDVKRILKAPSFVLFIKPENISSMSIKEKMTYLQNKMIEFVNIYKATNFDKELIPFISIYLETLQEALNTKLVPNIAIYSFFSSLIPFLCIMENTPQLSSIVLNYLIKNLNKLFVRINSSIDRVTKIFSDDSDEINNFLETQTTEIKLPSIWTDMNKSHCGEIKERKEIQNESFKFLTKDDLVIFLLPNAIVNCLQICYNSIGITQEEKDNECYLSYQTSQDKKKKDDTNYVLASSPEENEFLEQLNEESILIKKLRKEVKSLFKRNISKEIEEIEILVFKALLYQSQSVKAAMTVDDNSQIIPQIKSIWKTAIKVRTDLQLAKQFETNKKEVHLNLKERYDDYIKSIKEKCDFLLNLKYLNKNLNTNECVKQSYSFITSNTPLSKLFLLQEIIKKREEIRNISLSSINKMMKVSIPIPFMRSFISYLAKCEPLRKVLNENDDFYLFLVNSDDPFIRLCIFDFIEIDEYYDTALEMQSIEDDPNVLKFLIAVTDTEKSEIDIDHLLEIVGNSQYDKGNKSIRRLIKKISGTTSIETLISKLKGFDDISIGVLTIIKSFEEIGEKDINLLCPALIKLQSHLPNEIDNLKNGIYLNLFVSLLNKIIKFDYDLFKTKILYQIDISKFIDLIDSTSFVDIDFSDIIELYNEMKENEPKPNNEKPYFIQLKGNSSFPMSELAMFRINCFCDYNFYVFNKPIENNEKIEFHFDLDFTSTTDPYVLFGAINMKNEFIGFIPPNIGISNDGYKVYNVSLSSIDNFSRINLMKDPKKNSYSFYIEDRENKKYYKVGDKNLKEEPIIPFILIFSARVDLLYEYCPDFKPDKSYSFKKFSIDSSDNISNINEYMTLIPKNIVGNKIHINSLGDGVIIKTNDKNDNADIVLFNDVGDAALANVNLSSNKCNTIKEYNFITLLRSLIISDGFYNDEMFKKIINRIAAIQLSESLLVYCTFSLSTVCILFIFENENVMKRILQNYREPFVCLVNDNLEEIIETLECDERSICVLFQNDLVNDLIHFINCVSDKNVDISLFYMYFKYKRIQYEESDIKQIKKECVRFCRNENINSYLEVDAIFSSFNDILDFLLVHSFESVIENFRNIDDKYANAILCHFCNKPNRLPLLVSIIYNYHTSKKKFTIEANKKFVLSLKCINVENDELLKAKTEYKFDH